MVFIHAKVSEKWILFDYLEKYLPKNYLTDFATITYLAILKRGFGGCGHGYGGCDGLGGFDGLRGFDGFSGLDGLTGSTDSADSIDLADSTDSVDSADLADSDFNPHLDCLDYF